MYSLAQNYSEERQEILFSTLNISCQLNMTISSCPVFGRGREHTFLQQGSEKCWTQELCQQHTQPGSRAAFAQRQAAEGGEEISALVGEEGCWKHSV